MRKRHRRRLGRRHPAAESMPVRIARLQHAHPTLEATLVERIAHHSRDELAVLEQGRDELDALAERFAAERLDCLDAKREGEVRVLFLSTRNDGISQIAPALVNRAGTRVRALSAGLRPIGRVLRTVLDVLDEAGADVDACYPKPLTPEVLHGVDLVVTMLVDEPALHDGQRSEDWDFPDPAGLGTSEVRRLRDRISMRVDDLLESLS